jgi:methionyl-tRNA synthetase
MTRRYLDGERPDPSSNGELGAAWPEHLAAFDAAVRGCLLHEALAALWRVVGAANRYVDAHQPWALAKAAKAGDAEAAARLRDVLGELLEACRVIALTVTPFMPDAAARMLAQLGHELPYGPDGNGGPDVTGLLAWGAGQPVSPSVAEPVPLFPRLEVEEA